MAQATIVSICPFDTIETKPINNGYIRIPAAAKDDFVVVHLQDSSYIQRLAATDHNIKIHVPAAHIAKAVVDDFVNATVEASDEAGPGMAWFEGILTKTEILAKHKDVLVALRERQNRWFVNLCKKADDDWNQYHKVGMISDHQRYAAQYLGHNAPWLIDYNQNEGMIDCPACYTKIDARAVVCINCKAVLNREKAIQFGIIPTDNTNNATPKVAQVSK